MNIVVFDTETTSIDHPFCYNIGYKIANIESGDTLLKRDFIVKQVWENRMLFSTAYYKDKKELYRKKMRDKSIIKMRLEDICDQMIKDFENYAVELAFAYNSGFDERVFDFNCEWIKANNPFDNLPIRDIMNFVHTFIAFREDYQAFCEINKLFTENGNYSTSAETLFRYITQNLEFEEEHTALADSIIEFEILRTCVVEYGADITAIYKRYSSIPRKIPKELKVIDTNGVEHIFKYGKRRNYQDGNKIILKNY